MRGITASRHNPGAGWSVRQRPIPEPTEDQRVQQVAAATVLGAAFGILLGLSGDRARVGGTTVIQSGGTGDADLTQAAYTPPADSCGGCPACQV
ncbi:MAG: hypothetical protein ACREN4_08025 [Candidatus Dormibacteria bacterium]